jgi:hypothetical protein
VPDSRRWPTAVHEAGHYVVAVALGFQIGGATARRQGDVAGTVWARPEDWKPPQPPEPVDFVGLYERYLAGELGTSSEEPPLPDEPGDDDVVIAAGFTAEEIAGVRRTSGMPHELAELLCGLSEPGVDVARAQARRFLEERWEEVERVANLLWREPRRHTADELAAAARGE